MKPPPPAIVAPPPAVVDPPRQKTTLDIAMAAAQIASPLILGALTLWATVFGGLNQAHSGLDAAKLQAWATYQAKKEDTRLKILEAAIAVLKTPPDRDKSKAGKEARKWALKVVGEYKVAAPLPVPDWLPGPPPAAPVPPVHETK